MENILFNTYSMQFYNLCLVYRQALYFGNFFSGNAVKSNQLLLKQDIHFIKFIAAKLLSLMISLFSIRKLTCYHQLASNLTAFIFS